MATVNTFLEGMLWIPVLLAMQVGICLPMEARLDVVSRILHEVPLIDGHNDLPWNIRKFLKNQLKDFRFSEDLREVAPWSRSAWSHTDLGRLRKGMVAAQFWSAYVPCSSQHLDSVQLTLEQIDVIRRLVAKYPAHMALVTSAQGIKRAHESGRIASLIGIEGGHAIGTSLGVLRMFYQLGARYLTITHTCNTPWIQNMKIVDGVPEYKGAGEALMKIISNEGVLALWKGFTPYYARIGPHTVLTADCCIVDEPGQIPHIGGLSHFGTLVVKEMNRLGMMVDLSHVSVPTMLDALATSKAPVIFSHSSAHAICNSSRNVPDHVLRRLAVNGGLVMVSFYPYFISCSETATMQDVVAHINHIRDVAGVDHVGIGAGYDGINLTPLGLEDVSRYPYLLAELLESGRWSEDDVRKLAGRNLIRIFQQVEKVRDQLAAEGMQPLENQIPFEDILGRTYCKYSGT